MNSFAKRISAFLLVVVTVFALTACGCEHDYTSEVVKKADCISDGERRYTCNLCGSTYTEPIPMTGIHSYTSTVTKEATVLETGIKTVTCSVCGDSYTETIEKTPSNWKMAYYVDEFGDYTSSAYVVGVFTGSFSNSATSGSDLTVAVYVEKNYVYFRLLEYGSYTPSFSGSTDTYKMKIKNSSGTTKSYSLTLSYNKKDLLCSDSAFKNEIMNNNQLSITITCTSKYSYTPDIYTFKINNLGLKEIYNAVYSK